MEIRGATVYKNFLAQQHDQVFEVFKEFLSEIRPSQILEIGTAGGGLTLFIREYLNEIGLSDTIIRTYEIHDNSIYDTLRKNNIEVYIQNIFHGNYSSVIPSSNIGEFIRRNGITLILVDGGYKIGEFNALSSELKIGDFIMAHDYAANLEYFEEVINNKIWNWCEIQDKHIEESCKKNNLIKYKEDMFQKVVWTCRVKINNNESNFIDDKTFMSLFDKIDDAFFMQIGANDGIYDDPIYKLVKKKRWSGILFEPGIDAFSKLLVNYAGHDNLKFVNCAVSDFDGVATLFCGTTDPHFTLNKDKAISMFDIVPIEITVPVMSPTTIINQYNIQKIDLLLIDTEGNDFTIIKSFPFNKIKPLNIRFEFVNLSFEHVEKEDVIEFLSYLGYSSYIDEINGDIISILK